MRRSIPKLAAVLALAAAAPAAARDPQTDHAPGVTPPVLVQDAQQLGPSPDAHLDVARVRGIGPDQRTAMRAAAADTSVDMRILLLSADGTEPTFAWWKTALTNEGVPFDAVVASAAPPITAESLRAGVGHGRYQAVVLATGGLAYSTDGGFTFASALSSDEWGTLQAYEQEFGVREVDAYAYPQAAYGIAPAGGGRDMSGVVAQVTSAGASVFSDLVGPVPIDRWSWGYEATPVAGSSWQTLVDDANGAVVGTYVRADGTEALVNTVDTNEWSIHGHELFQGMLDWVTRGVHLGMRRNWFRMDVDDVFYPDDRWNMDAHTTPEDGSSTIRMTAADVERARAWQQGTGIHLNFLFNADGAKAGDPLTDELLAHKDDFTWENHTYSHADLDPSSQAQIEEEIRRNIEFGQANGLRFDPTELVTGGHSGLANAAMPAALDATGIRWFGADASRQPDQYRLANALSVPRHPTGVYYNVGTRAEELDEYNYLNYTACPAGNPGCLAAPADWGTLVDNEASMILRHVLDNDPRPHYVHQSNLAEDGVMYPVVDEVLARYRRLFKPDLVQPSLSESGRELERMAEWRRAVAAGAVTGTITGGGQVTITSTTDVPVPVTGTEVGSAYGGESSGWGDFSPGTETVGAGGPAAPTGDPGGTATPPSTPDDPIAFWSLDAGGGTTTIPDTAGGHTGYWRNGPPSFSDDGAADFGSPLYGEVNGVTAPTAAYTLDAWVWPNSAHDMTFVEHGGAGALGIVGGHIVFRQVSTDVAAPDPVEPGRWHHVAGTWDGTTARLYVDGALVASAAAPDRPSGTSTLYLGRGTLAGFMDGALDDVGYYATALPAATIAAQERTVRAAPPAHADDAPAAAQSAPAASVAVAAPAAAPPSARPHATTKKRPSRRRHHARRAKARAKARVRR